MAVNFILNTITIPEYVFPLSMFIILIVESSSLISFRLYISHFTVTDAPFDGLCIIIFIARKKKKKKEKQTFSDYM